MAERLVESLAPFLIVVSETAFFGYGWFYGIESGYTPRGGERTVRGSLGRRDGGGLRARACETVRIVS